MIYLARIKPVVTIVEEYDIDEELIGGHSKGMLSFFKPIFDNFPTFIFQVHYQYMEFFYLESSIDKLITLKAETAQELMLLIAEYDKGDFYMVHDLEYKNEEYIIRFISITYTFLEYASCTYFRNKIIDNLLKEI